MVGSLCLIRTQGCRKQQQEYLFHTNAVIPHKTSQQAHARLVTTLDLRQPRINTASARYPRNLSVTNIRPPSTLYETSKLYTRPSSHFSKHYLLTRVFPNTPGKNHLNATPVHLYTLQQKVLELSGCTK